MADAGGVRVRQHGEIAVIEAPKYINNDGGQAIHAACERLAAAGVRGIVLDLATCSLLNSVGVSYLIDLVEGRRRCGGHFAFCGASRTIARTLQIMGLLRVATIHEGQDGAMQATGERLRDATQGH